jgi:peptidylprolyl isomerase
MAAALLPSACAEADGPKGDAPPSSASATSTPAPSETPTADPTAAPTTQASALPRDEAGDQVILQSIEWAKGADGNPALVFAPPLGVTGPAARVIGDGDGAAIAEGDAVTFHYVMFAGDTGEQSYSSYATDRPQTIVLAREGMSETFAQALIGRRVGARVVFATIDSSGEAAADYLITQFMAVTVTAARPVAQRAEGKAVPPAAGLPAVTLAEDGAPSVVIPAADPPGELVSRYLIEGSGPALGLGQSVVVKLTGWVWGSGEMFDSTWESGGTMTLVLSEGATIEGLIQGLVGKKAGSQVLLAVPPSLGIGDNTSGAIPKGATLVYVVDLLAVL